MQNCAIMISFRLYKGNVVDKDFLNNGFEQYKPQIVVNLVAQTGVRYAIDYPDAYKESNIVDFYNIVEACRHYLVETSCLRLIFFGLWR